MYLPSCTTEMQSLDISGKTNILIQDFLEILQRKVPLGSRITFRITKVKEGFCGCLSVKSIHLNISLEHIEGRISKLLLMLRDQCDLDIQVWHRERILNA